MTVNDMVKNYGYTRDRLSHFVFCIYNPSSSDFLTIEDTTADDYILLCDREVVDWINEEDKICITLYLIPEDYDNFRKYLK